MAFYAIHESAGLTILVVALLRLLGAWRIRRRLCRSMSRSRCGRRPAGAPALYLVLILQPVLGFLATNAWGFPLRGETAYLGFIDLPKFMEPNTAGRVVQARTARRLVHPGAAGAAYRRGDLPPGDPPRRHAAADV